MTFQIPTEAPLQSNGWFTVTWRRFLSNLAGVVGDLTVYTPDVYAESGTITTASASATYQQVGALVTIYGQVQVTVNGTGAGAVLVSLPSGLLGAPTQVVGAGSQIVGAAVTGTSMQVILGGYIPVSGLFGAISISNADGTYPSAGSRIYFSITYEPG